MEKFKTGVTVVVSNPRAPLYQYTGTVVGKSAGHVIVRFDERTEGSYPPEYLQVEEDLF